MHSKRGYGQHLCQVKTRKVTQTAPVMIFFKGVLESALRSVVRAHFRRFMLSRFESWRGRLMPKVACHRQGGWEIYFPIVGQTKASVVMLRQ